MINSSARQETISYHRQFYARHALFEPGSWLHKPSPLVMAAAEYLERRPGMRILDLGCGVGRHCIPLAKEFEASRAEIIALDLLPQALAALHENSLKHKVARVIKPVCSDVETYEIPYHYFDFVISFSCIEHASSPAAFQHLVNNIINGTVGGGVNCLLINTNVKEVSLPDKVELEPLIECRLETDETCRFLKESYSAWKTLEFTVDNYKETVDRGGKGVIWSADFVCLAAKKPAK